MPLLPRLARLSKDSLIYGVGGAAARYTGLLLLPIYTRVFRPGEYGVLESVLNLSALLIAIVALGLDGAVPLLYFETEDAQERRRICAFWLWITLLVSVPVTLLLISLSGLISLAATGTDGYAGLYALGVAVLPFSLLQVVWSNILRLTFRPRIYALLSFSLTTLVALLSIAFVVFLRMGIEGALWGQLLGTATVSTVGVWMVWKVLRVNDLAAHVRRVAYRLVRLGLPLVPASMALWIISFSNTYFLIQLVGAQETGVFRAGARIAALLGLGIWAFQLAWTPFSLSLAHDPEAPRIYSRVATLYTAGAVGASVLMSALAPALLVVFTTGEYASAVAVIGLLSLSATALGAYYVVAIGVNLAQRTGQVAWTTITAAALNIGLNALLIPAWGILGAGVAALSANLTSTILIYRASQRFHPLPYSPGKIATTWLAGSACVAAAGIVNVAVQPLPWVSALFGVGLVGAYVIVLFASRVVMAGEVRALGNAMSAFVARRRRKLL